MKMSRIDAPRTMIVLFSFLLGISVAHAGKVTPNAAYATSSYNSTRTPAKTIDGSGLDSNGCHNTMVDNMWMSTGEAGKCAIMYSFEKQTPVSSIKIWNFNMVINGTAYTERGVKDITLFYATETEIKHDGADPFSADSNWKLLSQHTIGKASGKDDYEGEPVIVLDREISPRWIGIRIDSTHTTSGNYRGLSEVQFFNDLTPQIQAGSVAVSSGTEAVISGTLVQDGGSATTITITCTPINSNAPSVSASTKLDAAGDYRIPVSGLQADMAYQVVTSAVNEGGDSDTTEIPQVFVTSPVSITAANTSCWEDERVHLPTFTLSRPEAVSQVQLAVSLSFSGTAIAELDYVLPEATVVFPAGSTEVTFSVTPLHNPALVNAELAVEVAEGAYIPADSPASVTFKNIDSPAPLTYTWTGAAGSLLLSDAGNWSPEGNPGPADTIVFTEAGITADIAYGADIRVKKVVVQSPVAFKLGTDDDVQAGNILRFTDYEQIDAEYAGDIPTNTTVNSFFEHGFGAPLMLYPDENGNSTWNVEGCSVCEGVDRFFHVVFVKGKLIADPETVTLVKTGKGDLRPYFTEPEFGGLWRILGGTVSGNHITGNPGRTMSGTFEVGGPNSTGTPTLSSVRDALFGNATIRVLEGGLFTISGTVSSDRVHSVRVEENGTAEIKTPIFSCYRLFLKGGTVTNGGQNNNRFSGGGYGQIIQSEASDKTAVLSCMFAFNAAHSATITVEDGSPAIDLDMSNGKVAYGAKGITRNGAGTLLIGLNSTIANTSASDAVGFSLEGGRTVFDNPPPKNGTDYDSGSGAGLSPLVVKASATLAGSGYLGGEPANDEFSVTVSGSQSSPAIVSPGSVHRETGESLGGTLTVGDAVKPHGVTFGDYSKLELQILGDGSSDTLHVFGSVSISDVGTSLSLFLDENAPSGTYTLLQADGGITGSFADIALSGVAFKRYLTATENAICYTVPPRASMITYR